MNSATLDLRSSTEWPSSHRLPDTPSASQPKTTWEKGRPPPATGLLPGSPILSIFLLPFLPFVVSICVCVSLSLCLSCLFSPILSHPLSLALSLSLSLSLSALPSEFSEVVDLFTSCSVPLPPFPPELEKAGVTWLCLKWQRPTSSPKEDDIYYILEMEEEGSVCLA